MLRRKSKLTQQKLADLLGVTRQAICMWELNKREPDVITFNRIAGFFNITVDKLIKPLETQLVLNKEDASIGISKTTLSITEKKEVEMKASTTKKSATFELMAPQAKRVAVTGDFSAWDKSGIMMKKAKDGLWKAALQLKPGRYEYKFIVDGQWWSDPLNEKISTNPFGSKNSIKEI